MSKLDKCDVYDIFIFKLLSYILAYINGYG